LVTVAMTSVTVEFAIWHTAMCSKRRHTHLVGEDRYSFSDNNNEMQAVTRDAIYKQPKGG
jgi:uncharacterized protein YdeI (BOF family)